MIHHLRAAAIAMAVAFAGLAGAHAETTPAPLSQVEGTWVAVSANYNTSAGLFLILQIEGGGHIALTMKNKMGMSVTSYGDYRYNAKSGVLQQVYVDYEPKIPCVVAPCYATSPLPLDVWKSEPVSFENRNFMVLSGLEWSRW